ncbi:MAG TPA: tetratricopeptide repeat protein, partial [Nitrospiria bacterium]|nr:tetratricopeptide repeat protein [Nitrospiria bacterium]
IDSEQMGNAVTSRDTGFKLETRDSRLKTRSIRFLILEKLPLIALSIASSAITFAVQRASGAVRSFELYPLPVRLENAFVSYIEYLLKMVWPFDLAIFYPHPGRDIAYWQVVGSALFILIVSFWAIRMGRRYRYLPVGWFWYLGTLVPVIGIVQVGSQAMADRYTYLPLIGPFIIVAWGIPDLSAGLQHRKKILASLAGIAIAVLTTLTWVQVGYWRDSVTLFEHTLRATKSNNMARVYLGVALSREGRLDEAAANFSKVLSINPNDAVSLNNLGIISSRQGKAKEAIEQFRKAIANKPDYAEAHYNLGLVLAAKRKPDEAVAHYQRAIEIDPDYQAAHLNLGLILAGEGRLDEANVHLTRAVAIDPGDQKAQRGLGFVLAKEGKLREALVHYERALLIDSSDEVTQNNLGTALLSLGRNAEAEDHFRKALAIKPDIALFHYNLGIAEERLGKEDDAIREFQSALRIDPRFAPAKEKLKGLQE